MAAMCWGVRVKIEKKTKNMLVLMKLNTGACHCILFCDILLIGDFGHNPKFNLFQSISCTYHHNFGTRNHAALAPEETKFD